jgi:hypothetical protein
MPGFGPLVVLVYVLLALQTILLSIVVWMAV